MRKLGLAGLLLVGLTVAGLIVLRLLPCQPLGHNLSYSRAVYDSQGELLRLTLASDQRYRLWTELADVPAKLRQAVLLHEDQWFYWHPGFNPASLLRAAFASYLGAGRRQGGSTISMQLARMHWDLYTKNVSGKLLQIIRAIQLELHYSKDEILEAYLNSAPYGGNVEGAGTAGLIYFNKLLNDLSLPEIMALAVIPQAPGSRLATGGLESSALYNARQSLYQRWPESRENSAFMDMPLSMRSAKDLPFLAPHFVNQVLSRYPGNMEPGKQNMLTTLDLRLQRVLQQQATSFIAQQKSLGIDNAAALLLDCRDMGIKAMLGSVDFFNRSIHGQVNGSNAKRSPGSTLKPFIYALALEQSLLHPQTLLKDLPYNIGTYSPENFDQDFCGPITATQALVESRNIPAVQISAQLREPDLYQFLQKARISGLLSASHYGLALVLGGGELTMQEMARLYAILANQGKMHDLRFTQQEKLNSPVDMLSAEASFVTLKMLQENFRPGFNRAQHSYPVYWKTGTSWGFRDAWCAGIFGPYVLITWIGDFKGSGNPAYVGREAAAPLFFAIADNIMADKTISTALPMPEQVKQIEVCAISGMLPNQWCPHKTLSWFIPGKSPIALDYIHRPVPADGQQCTVQSLRRGQYQVHEYWPSDMARNFALAGLPRRAPPASACLAGLIDGKAPSITSPQKEVIYYLETGNSGKREISLSAISDAGVKNNFWFINDAFYQQARADEIIYWQPEHAGLYLIRVADDLGRADSRILKVEIP